MTMAVNSNNDSLRQQLQAGADALVSGSAFFGHKPYDARLAAFMKPLNGREQRPALQKAARRQTFTLTHP